MSYQDSWMEYFVALQLRLAVVHIVSNDTCRRARQRLTAELYGVPSSVVKDLDETYEEMLGGELIVHVVGAQVSDIQRLVRLYYQDSWDGLMLRSIL